MSVFETHYYFDTLNWEQFEDTTTDIFNFDVNPGNKNSDYYSNPSFSLARYQAYNYAPSSTASLSPDTHNFCFPDFEFADSLHYNRELCLPREITLDSQPIFQQSYDPNVSPSLFLDSPTHSYSHPSYYSYFSPMSPVESEQNLYVSLPCDSSNCDYLNVDFPLDNDFFSNQSYQYPFSTVSGSDKVLEPLILPANQDIITGNCFGVVAPPNSEKISEFFANSFCQPERGRPNRRKSRTQSSRSTNSLSEAPIFVADNDTIASDHVPTLTLPISPVSTPLNHCDYKTESNNTNSQDTKHSSPESDSDSNSNYSDTESSRNTTTTTRRRIRKKTTPKESYICSEPTCGKVFIRNHDLKRHFVSLHMKPSIECKSPKCKQMFSRRDNMMTHYESVHKNKRSGAGGRSFRKSK